MSGTIKVENHFAESCPCAKCAEWRERRRRCRPHGISGCMECEGGLKRPPIEVLWASRYHLRGIFTWFLRSRNPVRKFAALCPCELCSKWRARAMEEGEEER